MGNIQQPVKMAHPEEKAESSQKQGEDLSSILSTEERVELTLLLANITELMRKQITDTFDASITSAKPPQQALNLTDKNPNVEDTKVEKESEEEINARKLREQREKELSAPKMLELKEDSLKFFDNWRESVISRVGTAVNNSKEVVEEQKDKASVEATEKEPPSDTRVISSNTNIEEADAALVELYPPTSTSLYSLPREKRVLLLNAMLLLVLSLEHYVAPSRILLLHISSSLHLPLHVLAEHGVIVGSLFGAYGGRMTGKMMDAYAKEVEDFAFLPLKGSKHHEPKPEDRRLRVTIGVSGWITQREDTIIPWRALGRQSEVFALRWELDALSKLGSSLESVVKSAAWSVAKKEIISRTIFASLMTALWPIGLLKISKIVDNPFSVAKNRADKAGLVLADALINKAQGERPVTLIGYSLGARLIYSCLMSLAERRAFGLVESAVLIGAPAPSDAAVWRSMRSVVSGRLVNVYSENDYILAFLYRTSSIQYGVAGLQEAQDVKGVENVNVSEMVSGHL